MAPGDVARGDGLIAGAELGVEDVDDKPNPASSGNRISSTLHQQIGSLLAGR